MIKSSVVTSTMSGESLCLAIFVCLVLMYTLSGLLGEILVLVGKLVPGVVAIIVGLVGGLFGGLRILGYSEVLKFCGSS